MPASPPISRDALIEHLGRLDAVAVVSLAVQAVETGASLAAVGSELLSAWKAIDERLVDGTVDTATSVAAAAIARRALARASLVSEGSGPVAGRAPILIVTSAGSADQLGAEVLGHVVGGWPVDVLSGTHLSEELDAQLRARRPAAVIVSSAEVTDLPQAWRAAVIAGRYGVPVLAWGVAFGPDGARAERVGADCWVADLDDVVATLERWERTPPSPRAAVDEPTAFEELERQRPALLAATVNIGGADGEVSEWAHRTARSVVTHLAVAALVNDPTVLSDHLEAERRNLRRNNLLDVHLLGLIDALAGALPAEAGPATAYVLASREELRRSLLSPRPARPPEDEPEQANQAGRPLRSVGGGAEGSPRPAEASGAPAIGGPGQVFADILLLAALACQTPLALVSVPQGSGQWSTLSYGFEQRAGLNDPALFDYVAARSEPVEIPDLTAIPMLAGSPLAAAPHNLRWAYAVALRNPAGVVLGVVVVLDRWLRDLSRREQRALAAVARQMTGHLSSLRKVPASGAAQGAWTPPQGALQGPALKPAQPVDALAGIVGLRRSASLPDGQQLLRSHEVAVLFDVTERTVINWAAAGKLPSLRTIGGHLRFRSEDVLELLSGRTSGAKAAR